MRLKEFKPLPYGHTGANNLSRIQVQIFLIENLPSAHYSTQPERCLSKLAQGLTTKKCFSILEHSLLIWEPNNFCSTCHFTQSTSEILIFVYFLAKSRVHFFAWHEQDIFLK